MRHDVTEITDIGDERVRAFASLTDPQLRNKHDEAHGIFIAESPKVINVAINAGYSPIALLCEEKHVEGDAAIIIEKCGDIPIYTGKREVLANITGYTLTRGVLCAMRRKQLPSVETVCKGAKRIAVIDGVVDTTNIGAIFRSAAALGINGVLLTHSSCDPLNRRAVRVSMGSVFLIPWTWIDDDFDKLKSLGFKTVAMALTDKSVPLDYPPLALEPRLAIIMGTEGDGLRHATIEKADYTVRIPMAHGVDSLNVAAASAVAFWELGKQYTPTSKNNQAV